MSVVSVLEKTHPVAKALNLSDFAPLHFVKLAQRHQNLMLLALISARHESDLELIPELNRVVLLQLVNLFINPETWRLDVIHVEQLFQVVAADEVLLVQGLLITHFELSVVPLDWFVGKVGDT